MNFKFSVFDHNGVEYRCEGVLTPVTQGDTRPATGAEVVNIAPSALEPVVDFTLNERAFAKRYGADLDGSRIFVLLVAYLAKGDRERTVSLVDVEKLWNSMTSIFDTAFNRNYTCRAKENDWIKANGKASYSLRPDWQSIFRKLALAQ